MYATYQIDIYYFSDIFSVRAVHASARILTSFDFCETFPCHLRSILILHVGTWKERLICSTTFDLVGVADLAVCSRMRRADYVSANADGLSNWSNPRRRGFHVLWLHVNRYYVSAGQWHQIRLATAVISPASRLFVTIERTAGETLRKTFS